MSCPEITQETIKLSGDELNGDSTDGGNSSGDQLNYTEFSGDKSGGDQCGVEVALAMLHRRYHHHQQRQDQITVWQKLIDASWELGFGFSPANGGFRVGSCL